MTVDQLRRRIAELSDDRERAWAGVQQLVGAIEDCRYWLSALERDQQTESLEGPKLVKEVVNESPGQEGL